MTSPDADEELLQLFQDEATQRLDDMDAALLAAEAGNVPPDTIDALFRNAHTIKGAAGILGFSDIAALAHAAEDILALARSQRVLHPELAVPLLRATAALRARVGGAAEPFDGLIAELKASLAALEAGAFVATAGAAEGKAGTGTAPAGTGTDAAPAGVGTGSAGADAADSGPAPLATAGSWAARAGTGRPTSLPQPRPAFGPGTDIGAVPGTAPPTASRQPDQAPEPARGATAPAAAGLPAAGAQSTAGGQARPTGTPAGCRAPLGTRAGREDRPSARPGRRGDARPAPACPCAGSG